MNQRRREVAASYGELFTGAGLAADATGGQAPGHPIALPEPAGNAHVFHQYVIRVLPAGARDALRGHLEARGVETKIYYPLPLHQQPCFASLGYQLGDLPVAERLAHEVLALPMHPDLAPDEQERVVGEIAHFFARGSQAASVPTTIAR
jgi:dTDP-4-amino-4,6-dideoxygalactose transaminase